MKPIKPNPSFLKKYYRPWEGKKFEYLQRDLTYTVMDGLKGKFNESLYKAMDALVGIDLDNSSLEARIYQAYTGWPQVRRNIQSRGISKEDLLNEIRKLVIEQTTEMNRETIDGHIARQEQGYSSNKELR